jgi:hypothetical protein
MRAINYVYRKLITQILSMIGLCNQGHGDIISLHIFLSVIGVCGDISSFHFFAFRDWCLSGLDVFGGHFLW